MGEKRSDTYDQDVKDKQNAEKEAEHTARRQRLGHYDPSQAATEDSDDNSEEEN